MAKKKKAAKAKVAKAEAVKEPKEKTSKGDVDNGLACAVLAYLLVGIIWYFADEKMKKNAFAKFHVKQALVLLIASVVLWIIIAILTAIIIVPALLVGAGFVVGLFSAIFWIVRLIILVLVILGIVYAATGKKTELPVIGKYSDRFKF